MDCNNVQSAKDVLRRLQVSFRRCLNFQSISPYLRSHNLLTDHEWQFISDKGTREEQVDELLKYLPEKGESCLRTLIECLQSSLDHAGHKDLLVELKEQPELRISVKESSVNDMHINQTDKLEMLETRLEEKNKEVKLLRKELDELKTSHGNCIKELEDQLSVRDAKIQSLTEELESVSYSSGEDEGFAMFSISPVEANGQAESSSLDASCTEDYSDAPLLRKRSASDVTEVLKHSSGAQLEKDVTTHHKKRHNSKSEKTALIKTKGELENELPYLKDELDAVAFSHFGSVHHNLSYSSVEVTETKASASSLACDPVYQGWLLKEGGHKKHWRKRWCVLSSHFFFYFEGKDDPANRKRPVGILSIAPEMEVNEYVQEDLFELADKTRGYMKSYKLGRSKGGYVQGNHAVYKLQVSSNSEKHKWVESFNKVLENLKK